MPTLTSASLKQTRMAPKGARPVTLYGYRYVYQSGQPEQKGKGFTLRWSTDKNHPGFSGQDVVSAYDNMKWLSDNGIRCDATGHIKYSDIEKIPGHPAFVQFYSPR